MVRKHLYPTERRELRGRASGFRNEPRSRVQRQALAGFVRRRNNVAEFPEDAANSSNLVGVRSGEFAAADVEAVLQADADIAAHRRAVHAHRHLMAPRGQHRPFEICAEQTLRRARHRKKTVDLGPDPAEDAENELQKERTLV